MRAFVLASSALLFFHLTCGQTFNFTQCKADVQGGTYGLDGALDRNGFPLPANSNSSAIEGYMYSSCVEHCGTGSDLNSFGTTTNQFVTWFLPWFTLLAQVPYETRNTKKDFLIAFLSVGSPTTALFSLFVTLLDRVWLESKCDSVRRAMDIAGGDTTLDDISQVLYSLHQFPLQIEEVGLLACTVTVSLLPENKEWWKKLRMWFISRRRQMDPAAWAQLALVILIYLLSILPPAFLMLGGTSSTSYSLTRR